MTSLRRRTNCNRCDLEFDGSSKGNPGRDGAGAVIGDMHGHMIARAREGLGHSTNDATEYQRLRLGLDTALNEGCTDVTVETDSELIAKQATSAHDARSLRVEGLEPLPTTRRTSLLQSLIVAGLICAVQGYWKTWSPKMCELSNEAKGLVEKFSSFDIGHFDRVQGYWKIRNPKLHDLCYRVRGLANQFRSFNISHFDRGYNVDADTQANMATYLWPGEVQYENGDDYYKDNSVYVSGYSEAGEVYDEHGDDYYEDDEANYMQPQGGGYAVAGEVYDEHGNDYYDDEDISMQPQGGGCSVAGGVHHAQGGDYYGFKDNSAIAVGYSGVQDNTIQGDYSCQQGNCAKQEYDNPGRGDDYYNEVDDYTGQEDDYLDYDIEDYSYDGPDYDDD